MNDSIASELVIAQHSRTFSFAARWLPADIRQNVLNLYAWCRACDDAVDSAADLDEAFRNWRTLRDDVDRIQRGERVLHSASRWLESLMNANRVRREHALDLLEGMRMDLQAAKFDSDAALMRYCYHAAGVVGLMMCDVMQVKHPAARQHAKSLGMAMQLTNIVRDVHEDALRGRCYLPRIDAPLATAHDKISAEASRLLEMAENYYEHANAGLHYLPPRCQIAIRIAAACYREIGVEILRRGDKVLSGRVVVPGWRFLLVAIMALLRPLSSLCIKRVDSIFNNSFTRRISMSQASSQASNSARSNVYLGVSLTAFMATALFVMVYMHPKDESYALLPLVYAAVSLGIGIATNLAAKRALVEDH